MEKEDRRDQSDDSLLGAVALCIPNEEQVRAAASSPSTLRRLFSPTLMPASIDTTPGDESTSQEQRTGAKRRRRRQHNRDEMQVIDDSSPYAFSVEWLGSSRQPLHSIDVQLNTALIFDLNFSPDGSFLVSGGPDKSVRLWNTHEILGGNANSRPIQMEGQHDDFGVTCVAVSPNNRSIFSGGARDQTVLIHDIETSKLVRSVATYFSPDPSANPEWSGAISRISFQSGSDGNIFLPSLIFDVTLRIYDTRRPSNKSVIQFLKRQSPVLSALFSPVDANQLALVEHNSLYVVDIRKPKSYLHYLTNERAANVKYSYDGARLLCASLQYFDVYDLLPNKKLDGSEKISLPLLPNSICIFAGKEDELLISIKDTIQLSVWQLPSAGSPGNRTLDSPLLEFNTGHQSNVACISFNKSNGVLASSERNGVIKLWVANEEN